MERRRFARYAVLLGLPSVAGCDGTGSNREPTPAKTATQSDREPTPVDNTTTSEETTRTYQVEYNLSGKVVPEAPMGVDPSPYPDSAYENPYLTEVIEKAVEEPDGTEVFVVVPEEDEPAVREDRTKLNGNDKGVYAEYEGAVVRIWLIKYE